MFGIEIGVFDATKQYPVVKKGFRWFRKPIIDYVQFPLHIFFWKKMVKILIIDLVQ